MLVVTLGIRFIIAWLVGHGRRADRPSRLLQPRALAGLHACHPSEAELLPERFRRLDRRKGLAVGRRRRRLHGQPAAGRLVHRHLLTVTTVVLVKEGVEAGADELVVGFDGAEEFQGPRWGGSCWTLRPVLSRPVRPPRLEGAHARHIKASEDREQHGQEHRRRAEAPVELADEDHGGRGIDADEP